MTDRLKRGVNKTIRKHFYSDAFVTRRQYFRHNGFYPDLENPKDLSEKISWLKLHDRSALHTLCADKIAVRDYVTACVGPELLVPALLVTRDPSNVRPDAIAAEAFVVKTSHDQGGVFLCRDRARFDWEGVRAQVVARFRINKYEEFREHQYKGIRPGVIVEQFVAGEAGDPFEIKIHCMHGTPAFLQVIQDRFGNRRQAFYGPDWTRLAMRGRPEPIEAELPAPPRLEPMLRTAEALAAPFLFARVDFLIGAGGLPWFGEITFHPGAGLLRYAPPEIERAFGDMIDLSRLEATREAQRRVLAAIRPAGTR